MKLSEVEMLKIAELVATIGTQAKPATGGELNRQQICAALSERKRIDHPPSRAGGPALYAGRAARQAVRFNRMQKVVKGKSSMSIWKDKKGKLHVGIMVEGKRVHRELPEGATAGDAKLIEAEIRAAVARAPKQKQVQIPGDPPMTAILAIYVEHSDTLRSGATSKHHAKRLGPWAERYKASQAQEFADHVIRDMSKLIPDRESGKMKPAYAAATINRSLACAKKGLQLAWRQRLIPETMDFGSKTLP